MAMTTMTEDERTTFLADQHVGVLAVARHDGPPEAVPVWYQYRPGEAVEFVTHSSSAKVALLEAAGHASLCAQREDYPYAYVTAVRLEPMRWRTADYAKLDLS